MAGYLILINNFYVPSKSVHSCQMIMPSNVSCNFDLNQICLFAGGCHDGRRLK